MKKKIEQITKGNPIIKEEMSEDRMKYFENILNRIEQSFEKRFDKIDSKLEKQDSDIADIEDRVVVVEKNNAITRREIAIYVTIGVFVLLQVLEKINVI